MPFTASHTLQWLWCSRGGFVIYHWHYCKLQT